LFDFSEYFYFDYRNSTSLTLHLTQSKSHWSRVFALVTGSDNKTHNNPLKYRKKQTQKPSPNTNQLALVLKHKDK